MFGHGRGQLHKTLLSNGAASIPDAMVLKQLLHKKI